MKLLLSIFMTLNIANAFDVVSELAFEKYDEKSEKTISYYPNIKKFEDGDPDFVSLVLSQEELSDQKEVHLTVNRSVSKLITEKEGTGIVGAKLGSSQREVIVEKKKWKTEVINDKTYLRNIPFLKYFTPKKGDQWIDEVEYIVSYKDKKGKEVKLSKKITSKDVAP